MVDANLYCKVFVDADVSREQLAEQVARAMSGTVEMRTVITPHGEIDVSRNEDFDEGRRHDADEGFLFYPYYLDIDNTGESTRAAEVVFISKLLDHLWSLGYSAVAACDYEGDLPNKGRLVIPQSAAA